MRKQNKSSFIRAANPNTPAADVVAEGKKRGLNFSVAYVHSVRSAAKREKNFKKEMAKEIMEKSSSKKPAASTGINEETLLAVAQELGYKKSLEIIQRERDRIFNKI